MLVVWPKMCVFHVFIFCPIASWNNTFLYIRTIMTIIICVSSTDIRSHFNAFCWNKDGIQRYNDLSNMLFEFQRHLTITSQKHQFKIWCENNKILIPRNRCSGIQVKVRQSKKFWLKLIRSDLFEYAGDKIFHNQNDSNTRSPLLCDLSLCDTITCETVVLNVCLVLMMKQKNNWLYMTADECWLICAKHPDPGCLHVKAPQNAPIL